MGGSCTAPASTTGYPPAESMPQPISGMASIKPYSSTCDAIAARCCARGIDRGNGGGRWMKRLMIRTSTSNRMATPIVLCSDSSARYRGETVATMPTPIHSMARMRTAIAQ
ncbi:hypothetical protein D3C85_1345220 [compost metagenome]